MNEEELELEDGSTLTVRYHQRYPFSRGTVFLSDNSVTYRFTSPSDSSRIIAYDFDSLNYGSDQIKKTLDDVLPRKATRFVLNGGTPLLSVKKNPDCYPLKVVEGALDPRIFDTALMWTISRLIKTCVFLKMNSLRYPGFVPDNVFVWASGHTIFLPGEWWDIHDLQKGETYRDELQAIRDIARDYFSGSAYPEVQRWAGEKAESDPFLELEIWDDVVDESVHVREFVPLDLPPDEVWALI
jgi:hypothetical protein